MKMFRTNLMAGVAAAFALSSAAQAAVTFTTTDGPDAGAPGGYTVVLNYDGVANPAFSESGGTVGTTPLVFGVSAPPLGTPDGEHFKFLTEGQTYTLLTPLITGFSFYLGSLDSFNNVSFFNGALELGSFSGNDLGTPKPGDVNQTDPTTNRRYTFNFGGDTVDRVVFFSGGNSMEWDTIAVPSAVPEPATWAMMITGFGLLGAALRRRRHLGAAAV